MTVTQRPSIRKVAEHAGVSRMTVSRVLNNQSERFSEETRERVLKAVRELEYRPVAGPTTQSRNVETRVLGLVFDGTPLEGFWGLPTFWGLSEAAVKNDYDLLTMWRARPDWMSEQQELQFLDRRSDGFIFVAPVNRFELLEKLIKHGVPAVTCYYADVPPGVSSVVLDNAGAMKLAVDHLVEQGHRRIMHIAPPSISYNRYDFRERGRGFESSMKLHGLEPLVFDEGLLWETSAAKLFMEKIRRYGITALACSADSLASLAWDVLEANGMSVPDDVSVIGMDDLAEMAQRGLTSVQYSCEEVGRQAAQALLRQIQGAEGIQRAVVPVRLEIRTSVAPPAT